MGSLSRFYVRFNVAVDHCLIIPQARLPRLGFEDFVFFRTNFPLSFLSFYISQLCTVRHSPFRYQIYPRERLYFTFRTARTNHNSKFCCSVTDEIFFKGNNMYSRSLPQLSRTAAITMFFLRTACGSRTMSTACSRRAFYRDIAAKKTQLSQRIVRSQISKQTFDPRSNRNTSLIQPMVHRTERSSAYCIKIIALDRPTISFSTRRLSFCRFNR